MPVCEAVPHVLGNIGHGHAHGHATKVIDSLKIG